jgi:hypothetical protein
LDRFVMAWSGTWARYGTSDEGIPHYIGHLAEVQAKIAELCTPPILMKNDWGLRDSLGRFVFANAISPAKLQQLRAPETAPHLRQTA